MAEITINTTDPQYQQALNALSQIRTLLAPRVQLLVTLPHEQQRAWLERDPLLRRALRMAQTMADMIREEVPE